MARTDAPRDTTREAWSITLFDDRYGVGSQDRLLMMLRQSGNASAGRSATGSGSRRLNDRLVVA